VLEQNPSAGSIVKAGRRITLVVSRGAEIETMQGYVGQTLSDAQGHLQTLFSGTARPLVTLGEPSYVADVSEQGTILAQDPPAGTAISEPVVLRLVVSRGPQFEVTNAPNLVGRTVQEVLPLLVEAKVVFDFSTRLVEGRERPGTVVWQEAVQGTVPNFTRVQALVGIAEDAERGLLFGVIQGDTAVFPYPEPVQLRSRAPDGTSSTFACTHPGGLVTLPYAALPGTELTLLVAGTVVTRQLVR
jgi:beta-lactam-binding protein with PASTA domain